MKDAVRHEIDFILGSIEMCQHPLVKPILDAHKVPESAYGWMDTESEPAVAADINTKLFETGIFQPVELEVM